MSNSIPGFKPSDLPGTLWFWVWCMVAWIIILTSDFAPWSAVAVVPFIISIVGAAKLDRFYGE